MADQNDKQKKPHHPHDSGINKAFSFQQVGVDLLKRTLPAPLIQSINFDTLRVSDRHFIDDEHKHLESDTLYEADIKNTPGYIYALTEHRSTPDKWLPLRLRLYALQILSRHVKIDKNCKKLPTVVILLFYHGKQSPYPYTLKFFDLFADPEQEKANWQAPLHILDTADYDDTSLLASQDSWLDPLIWLAKHIWDVHIDKSLARTWVASLRSIDAQTNGSDYVSKALLKYFFQAGEMHDKSVVIDAVAQNLSPDTRDKVMTIAEQFKQEGAHQEKQQIATNMLNEGLEASLVSRTTGLPLDEIKRLKVESEH